MMYCQATFDLGHAILLIFGGGTSSQAGSSKSEFLPPNMANVACDIVSSGSHNKRIRGSRMPYIIGERGVEDLLADLVAFATPARDSLQKIDESYAVVPIILGVSSHEELRVKLLSVTR
jgi:hypothetical protein